MFDFGGELRIYLIFDPTHESLALGDIGQYISYWANFIFTPSKSHILPSAIYHPSCPGFSAKISFLAAKFREKSEWNNFLENFYKNAMPHSSFFFMGQCLYFKCDITFLKCLCVKCEYDNHTYSVYTVFRTAQRLSSVVHMFLSSQNEDMACK